MVENIYIDKETLKKIVKEILTSIFDIDIYGCLYVDILGSENTVIDEILTGEVSSPQTILTPESDKYISTRNIFLASDSDSGEVECKFKDSNKLIGKIYCAKFKYIQLSNIKIDGNVNEPIIIAWNGLDSNAKIFYALRYKIF